MQDYGISSVWYCSFALNDQDYQNTTGNNVFQNK